MLWLRVLILSLALLICAMLILTLPRVKVPERQAPESTSIANWLVRNTGCFTWTEVIGDSSIDHRGGVVFLWKDNKIYSRAWFTRAKYAREWPPVFGVGTAEGNMLHVAYRSASVDPKHEFYHVVCHFEFSTDSRTFICRYMQRASSRSEELTPGAARGTRVESRDEFEEEIDRVKARISYVEQHGTDDESFEHCPVIKENKAMPQNEALYEGKLYHFCCLSCRDVFLKNPRVFVGRK
jgi:YHS domain-containing protein